MKTINDFKALLPILIKFFSQQEHQVGESYWDKDEDGWDKCDDYKPNCFIYEEDGWEIEVCYECCGEWDNDPGDYWTPPCHKLVKAWGEVTKITAYHYDDETEEESKFDEDDLREFFSEFDKELEDIIQSNQ